MKDNTLSLIDDYGKMDSMVKEQTGPALKKVHNESYTCCVRMINRIRCDKY